MNEWFLLVSLTALIATAIILPRRFPSIVTIVFLSLGLGVGMWVDYQLSQPPFDLYYVDDTRNYGLFDLGYYLLYSPFSYLFFYFLDKWKIQGASVILYVVSWTAMSLAYESLAVHFHGFTYTGWKLRYSIIVYLIVQSFYVWLYHLIKTRYIRTKSPTGREWV